MHKIIFPGMLVLPAILVTSILLQDTYAAAPEPPKHAQPSITVHPKAVPAGVEEALILGTHQDLIIEFESTSVDEAVKTKRKAKKLKVNDKSIQDYSVSEYAKLASRKFW